MNRLLELRLGKEKEKVIVGGGGGGGTKKNRLGEKKVHAQ